MVDIPNDFTPRVYQRRVWEYFAQGGRKAVTVWPRRAGKDTNALHIACTQAMQEPGNYWHLFPEQTQARKAIWNGIDGEGKRIIDRVFPNEIRNRVSNQEMLIELGDKSTWQLGGSDRFDALVGSNPRGVVFSEYAISDPRAWDFVRPVLAENGGWAIFPYTPRGRNHGADLFESAKLNPSWFAELLTVDDTGHISAEALAEERAEMDEDLFLQEYYCSFDAGVAGNYYGKQMAKVESEGRLNLARYDPTVPVSTYWDLGIGDSTAIWFAQRVGMEVRLIDYYEMSGEALDHYIKYVKELPYVYDRHVAPHDIEVRELISGKSRREAAASLGINFEIAPRLGVDEGINAVRMLLPRCYFDREKCGRGISALRAYRKDYDDRNQIWKAKPVHDWSSHGSDAFRYLAVSWRDRRAVARVKVSGTVGLRRS